MSSSSQIAWGNVFMSGRTIGTAVAVGAASYFVGGGPSVKRALLMLVATYVAGAASDVIVQYYNMPSAKGY